MWLSLPFYNRTSSLCPQPPGKPHACKLQANTFSLRYLRWPTNHRHPRFVAPCGSACLICEHFLRCKDLLAMDGALEEGFSARFEHTRCHTLRTLTLVWSSAGSCKTAAVSPGKLLFLPFAAATTVSIAIRSLVICTTYCCCSCHYLCAWFTEASLARALQLYSIIYVLQ